MTQEIKLVQGFQGDFHYLLNFTGEDINVSNTKVYFKIDLRVIVSSTESVSKTMLCRADLNGIY